MHGPEHFAAALALPLFAGHPAPEPPPPPAATGEAREAMERELTRLLLAAVEGIAALEARVEALERRQGKLELAMEVH